MEEPRQGRARRRKTSEAFMIASASETGPATSSSKIPAWRIALGNIAAGATAGATVEAGKSHLIPDKIQR